MTGSKTRLASGWRWGKAYDGSDTGRKEMVGGGAKPMVGMVSEEVANTRTSSRELAHLPSEATHRYTKVTRSKEQDISLRI